MEGLMEAMKTFLLRLPESMMEQVALIANETYTTKTQFLRNSVLRNLEISRMEMQLLRNYYKDNDTRLMRIFESTSNK